MRMHAPLVLPGTPAIAVEPRRRQSRIGGLLSRDAGLTITLALALCLSVVSLAYFLHVDLVTAYGDAVARLLIARTVLESRHPGLAQLGGVWPPFPQVYMLPFVWNDFLYYTGLAGAIPSAVSYVVSSAFLYKLVARLTRDQVTGLIAVVAFSGPNTLYLQSVPMSEMPFIACFLAAVYFAVSWMLDGSLRALFLAGLAALLGTLTRYEGWVLVVLLLATVVYACWRGGHRYHEVEGHLVYFGLIAAFGIGLWLLWNRVIFHDALYFMHSQYSAKEINHLMLMTLAPSDRPTGDARLSVLVFGWTVLDNIGPVGVALAVLGLARLVLARSATSAAMAALLLLFPIAFSVFALYTGAEVIADPNATPGEQISNVRFGLLLAPAAGFLAGWLAQGRWMRWPVLAGCLVSALFVWQGGLVNIADAAGDAAQNRETTTRSGEWLHDHYDHGLVLMQRRTNENLLFASRIPLEDVVYEGDGAEWDNGLRDPASEVRWIVMDAGDAQRALPPDDAWRLMQGTAQLTDRFELAYENGPVRVYRIKSP